MTPEDERIIKMADERGDFLALEDGYIYFDPTVRGAMGSHTLRLMADELDRRNAEWDAKVQYDLGVRNA